MAILAAKSWQPGLNIHRLARLDESLNDVTRVMTKHVGLIALSLGAR